MLWTFATFYGNFSANSLFDSSGRSEETTQLGELHWGPNQQDLFLSNSNITLDSLETSKRRYKIWMHFSPTINNRSVFKRFQLSLRRKSQRKEWTSASLVPEQFILNNIDSSLIIAKQKTLREKTRKQLKDDWGSIRQCNSMAHYFRWKIQRIMMTFRLWTGNFCCLFPNFQW